MMDALADGRRRELLFDVSERESRDDSQVSIVAPDDDVDAVGHLVSMKYTHLPKLDTYGFIEWDETHHEVTKGPDFDQIRPMLEFLEDHQNELPAI